MKAGARSGEGTKATANTSKALMKSFSFREHSRKVLGVRGSDVALYSEVDDEDDDNGKTEAGAGVAVVVVGRVR